MQQIVIFSVSITLLLKNIVQFTGINNRRCNG